MACGLVIRKKISCKTKIKTRVIFFVKFLICVSQSKNYKKRVVLKEKYVNIILLILCLCDNLYIFIFHIKKDILIVKLYKCL